MKKILIIGGGYAGVKAGKTLHKLFRKNDDVEITLVDAHGFHTMMTELHEVAAFRTEPDAIRIDLKKIFAGRKVNIEVDFIESIDFEKKIALSKNNTYAFDYIVLGTGAEPNYFGIEGIEENSFSLWSYEDAIKLRHHIENMFALASKSNNPEKRKELLTFSVVGSGFTGVEMAGELGSAKTQLCKEYNIDPSEVTIYNIEAMSRILNTLESDKQIAKVEKKYKKLGVTLMKDSPIVKADSESFTLKNGRVIKTKTLIWTAGIKSSTFSSHLGLETGRAGRLMTNEYLQSTNKDFVFVVGDNTWYEDEDGPLPQIVEAAEGTGHTAALNIGALINEKELHKHKQNYHGFMVSVGSRYCVSDTNGLRLSGWFAMLLKHLVNMFYQFMVGGVRQLWTYCRHQFFHIKHRRSFVGGHFSRSSQNIWRLPLRVWLGYMWLVEGVAKIAEGWLKEPKVVATANAIFNAANTTGAEASADSYSGATEAVTAASVPWEGGSEAVTAASVPWEGGSEAVTAASVPWEGGSEAVASTFQVPDFIQWGLDKKPPGYGESLMDAPQFMIDIMNSDFFVQNEVLIQTFMVFAEIVIGLCLIFGLFTFLASIISIGIGAGITFTGMADSTMIWYIVSAIALVPGAGSVFGLDYYIGPKIKHAWMRSKFARKSYLYFDDTGNQ